MVFRDRRPSRHRAEDTRPAEQPAEDELELYLAAISPEADLPESSDLTGRFGSAQVFQVRLPALRIEQLRRLAEAQGVPPTSLVVDWVIERLDQEDPGYGADEPSTGRRARREHTVPDPHAYGRFQAPTERVHTRSRHTPREAEAPLSPIEQLSPIGELTSVEPDPVPASPVTPLFGEHAARPADEQPRRARHRAPEPITSLHTRRKF